MDKRYYMLDIDLTTGKSEKIDVTDMFKKWIGGAGVATRLLVESVKPETDPLSEDNVLIFAIGPLNNHFPVITKTIATFKSPLTGDFGESHAGGNLSLALYQAGFHVLRIRGKAKELSLVKIDNEKVEIVKANSLKGMSATGTRRVLLDNFSRRDRTTSVLRIGPAGERLSPIACIAVDSSRHFGRLGIGAVMGSKNIKAIIISGDKYWKAPKGKYNTLYTQLYKQVTKSELMRKYHDLGTAANIIPLSRIHGLPVRNYSQGFFESAELISGEAMADKHLAQKIACAGCQVGCIHLGDVRELYEEEHHMYKTKRVSYDHEPLYAFGSNLSINSSDMVLKLLHKVEREGWDAISMGVTLAWATEAFQKGIISETETDGEILNFGDGETYLRVLDKIAGSHNEFYRNLEKGAYYCCRKYGGCDFAIVFNKNEAPGYLTGIMTFLGYSTDTRHSHLGNAGYSIDEKLKNRETPLEERMKQLYDEGIWRIAFTSLAGCLFSRHIYHQDGLLPKMISALEIEETTDEELLKKARAIHGMKYKFKFDCGFSFENLKLPEKLLSVMTSNGKMSQEEFKEGIEMFRKWVLEDIEIYESYAKEN